MNELQEFGALRMPREILFGNWSAQQTAQICGKFGPRVFVVTDAVMQKLSAVQDVVHSLSDNGLQVRVFADTSPEIPLSTVDDAQAQLGAFDPDVIVGLGGGSCIDLAKVLAVLAAHGGSPRDYYGENQVPGPCVPVVAIPTTAGTGSEATPVAVIADEERDLKVGISSPHLIPSAAIVDPRLTLTCPASVTAHSGLDALAHAVESLASRRRLPAWGKQLPVFLGVNQLTEQPSLRAITLINQNLVDTVRTPRDIVARAAMAEASLLAGIAFGTAGTGAAHALQYPIGALTQTPHGLGTGLLLPYVMQFNKPYSVEDMARIGWALGSVSHTAETAAQDAIDRVAQLVSDSGVPTNLREIGVAETDLPTIAELGMKSARLIQNNARPCTPQSLLELATAAWSGERRTLDAA